MLARALIVAVVLSGAANDLIQTKIPPLKLSVPAVWNHQVEDGSHKFYAPSGDANLSIDVGKTARAMSGDECLGKITGAIGGDWQRLSIGGSPAAKKVEGIHNDRTGGDIVENTYVGCNGITTWSVIFRVDAKKRDQFLPVGEAVVQSIQYMR
jgi:hypothetical protein